MGGRAYCLADQSPEPRPIDVRTTEGARRPPDLRGALLQVIRIYEHWRERRFWWARPIAPVTTIAWRTIKGHVRLIYLDLITHAWWRSTTKDAMKPPDYIELHAHSAHSLLDGVASPELVARAADYEMPALALTDLGRALWCRELHPRCGSAGIRRFWARNHRAAVPTSPAGETATGYTNLAQLIAP